MTVRIDGHLRWRKYWAKTKYGNYHVSGEGHSWHAELWNRNGDVAVWVSLGKQSGYEAIESCEKDYMRRVHDEYEEVCR